MLTEECDNCDDGIGDHEEDEHSEFTDQYAQGELAAEEGCQAEGEGCSDADSSSECSRSDCS